jgi:hypothetical protein
LFSPGLARAFGIRDRHVLKQQVAANSTLAPRNPPRRKLDGA